jgi:hypothetical protein
VGKEAAWRLWAYIKPRTWLPDAKGLNASVWARRPFLQRVEAFGLVWDDGNALRNGIKMVVQYVGVRRAELWNMPE